ncbi:prenyltransferase/squalene oxidase repeat-containing protein [Dactylosporangium sucinum]|uniref:Squalene cyclase C-terminal domain-containing protein n=1 Tax=Dactylosporangium sucinum TaxID=1424081 RepID=A0A917U1Y1_9ACTN|nr:prenyltransferase/squalene oxidase repeat-containing protein [Dactylosporangium sucinum]GGM51328.1 hypothetical protein GCM10007977_061350 [Dactylosporangium sucinum]
MGSAQGEIMPSDPALPAAVGQRIEVYDQRGRRVSAQLVAAAGPTSEVEAIRVVTRAVASQHPDGSWGSDQYPRLKPCYTAQTIDLLYRLNVLYPAEGEATAQPGPAKRVRRAADWLLTRQHKDGTWGEDAWDTCRVLSALDLCGIGEDREQVRKALGYLRDCVDHEWPDRRSFWFGPGFLGAALEVFNRFGDIDAAQKVLDQLRTWWDDESGRFAADSGDGTARAPAEWHTAWAIIGLNSVGSYDLWPDITHRAELWLTQAQAGQGCWVPGNADPHITQYCTSQVVLALAPAGGREESPARRGTEWLMRQCTEVEDPLNVTLMAAAAVAQTHRLETTVRLPYAAAIEAMDLVEEYADLTKDIGRQIRFFADQVREQGTQITSLSAKISSLDRDLDEALDEIKVRHRPPDKTGRAAPGGLLHRPVVLVGVLVLVVVLTVIITLLVVGPD